MPITGGGAANLDGLSDVVITSATEGDVLNYRSGSWVNTSSPHIGNGTQPTGPASGDISSFGRLYIGSSASEADAYVADMRFCIKNDIATIGTIFANRILVNFTGSGNATGGVYTGLKLDIIGGGNFTSGALTLSGFDINALPVFPTGTSGSSFYGLRFSAVPSGSGGVNEIVASDFIVAGSSGAGSTASSIIGVRVGLTSASAVTGSLIGVQVRSSGAAIGAAVTAAAAFDIVGGFGNNTNVVTWSGIRGAGPAVAIANKWFLDLTGNSTNLGSRIAHKIALGWNPATVATITARAMLAVGAAGAGLAPLKHQVGTLQTTAEAGAEEYDGNYLYITHGDAVRTKVATQRGAVDSTGLAAAVGATTLYTPPAAGYYVVHWTLEITTLDATAGTMQFQVNYTDDIGATNQVGAALLLTAQGRDRGTFQVYVASGAITYQTNLVGAVNNARYALRVRLESLG